MKLSPSFWPLIGTIGCAAAVLLWLLGQFGQLVGSGDADFIGEAQAALHAGPIYRARIARLAAAQATHTVYVTQWRTVADTASTDSARALAFKAALRECETALLACSERAALAEARVRELEPLLTRGVQLANCHILGIGFLPKCPSRSASLVVGATAGAIGTLVLTR